MPVDHSIEDKTRKVKVDAKVEGKTGDLDFGTLKSGGIIKQRQKDLFTVRLRCPGGRIPVKKLKKIAKVAERYGGDYVHLSFRQSLEIPYVHYKNIGQIQKDLAPVGQQIASCGARVRVPTACSGCEYNPNGIMDTQKMTQLVDQTFFGTACHHKFKISFSGCPIDCARTNEMDLGFQGAVKPRWVEKLCTGCRLCATACSEGAIDADKKTGQPIYHAAKCLYCGDCIRNCPVDAWVAEDRGWMVRCAGKHGRHPVNGHKIAEFVSDEDVPKVIQGVLDWYNTKNTGIGRTRITTVLQRPGKWQSFVKFMKPVLGKYAVKNPVPPTPNEIHFDKRATS